MRKTIVIILCAVLCVGAVAFSAGAKTVNGRIVLDYNDYVSNAVTDGDNDVVTITLPENLYGLSMYDYYGYRSEVGQTVGDITVSKSDSINETVGFYYPGGGVTSTYLDASNIPDGSVISLNTNIWIDPNYDYTGENLAQTEVNVDIYAAVEYMDSDFNYLANTSDDYASNATVRSGGHTFTEKSNIVINKPAGTKYLNIHVRFTVVRVVEGDLFRLYFSFNAPKLNMSISSLYRQQEQTGKTNKLLENLPDKIGDEFRDVLQEEHEKAELGGNSSVGDLESAIPDYSAGFMDALSEFAESMSYTGTDAKLKIPGITMPEIAGVIPKYEIMQDTTLDFEVYIGYLPDGLLLLVQSLLTIALIIYCFKELYDTIAYVLTLRRGADG